MMSDRLVKKGQCFGRFNNIYITNKMGRVCEGVISFTMNHRKFSLMKDPEAIHYAIFEFKAALIFLFENK